MNLQLCALLFPPQPFAAEVEQQFLLDYSGKYAARRKLLSVVALGISVGYFLVDIVYAFYDPQHEEVFSRVIFPYARLVQAR